MNRKELNQRKNELLNQQDAVLRACEEAKREMTSAEEENFGTAKKEIESINAKLERIDFVAKNRGEIAQPTSQIEAPISGKAMETRNAKRSSFSNEYSDVFYGNFQNILTGRFVNAALGEGGTTDGGFLVPITVDGTIVPLAPQETTLRQLAKVIPTTMDIKLPAQAAKTVAAAKAESRTGNNAFGGTAPTFTQKTLSAFMAGAVVPVTIELAQDVPALQEFLNQDISDGILVYEDDKFVNGSGSGEPEGVLTGATAAQTAALSADAGLDLIGKLNPRYYGNAQWLMNRQTGINLRKKQLDANQFLPFWTNVNGVDYFHGFKVNYSAAVPVFDGTASPVVDGKIVFGDFKAGMVIGDRGGSGIAVKVLDQTSILNGVLDVLGYRRTDSRVRLAQALQVWTING